MTPSEPLVGTELTVEVGPVAHGGHFVARHEGRVVFVRHALPGERVVVRVTEGEPDDRFLRADAVRVLSESADRVLPPCPYAGPDRCGGCDFQHVSLPAQRRLKADVVREQLLRVARLPEESLTALGVPSTAEALPGAAAEPEGLGWRTRVELTASPRARMGLRKHRSHEVVELDRCLIASAGVESTEVLRHTWDAGVTGVDVVEPSLGLPVAVPLPETGPAPVVQERVVLPGRWQATFAVSARGFWQVHPSAAATFVEAVLTVLTPLPGDRAVDLYAGVGLFAAALADAVGQSGQVVAVESDPLGVPLARANLASRRQALVVPGRVEDALGVARKVPGRSRRGASHRRPARSPLLPERADLVVLDPPRTGAGRGVVGALADMEPRAVAYVACDPAALARDVAYLAEAGYGLTGIRVIDAFPMTHHVECVAAFEPATEAGGARIDSASADEVS